MNAEKLVELKQHLRDTVINVPHPEVHLDMGVWAYEDSDVGCGKAVCLAGHLVLMVDGRLNIRGVGAHTVGARALEILDWRETNEWHFVLFYTDEWPEELEVEHAYAETDAECARVAIRAIDWWLGEQGYDPEGRKVE